MENRKKAALIARLAGACAVLLTIDYVMWLVQLGGRFPFFHSPSFYRIIAWCFLAVALF